SAQPAANPSTPDRSTPVAKPVATLAAAAKVAAPAPQPKTNSPSVAILDPNITPYPRASLHNYSDLLEAPAGKRGFVESKNGHFYYQDGTRARFWGINVANTSLQESEADISALIQNFRAAGFNLIRLHHFDERGGIIDLDAP